MTNQSREIGGKKKPGRNSGLAAQPNQEQKAQISQS